MAKKYTDEFRRDAVQMATTSGLTRPQLSSDLGGWRLDAEQVGHQHHYVDLMSGPQKDVEKKIPAFAKNSGHCALRSKCGKTRDLLCSPKPMSFPSSMLGKPFDLWFFLRYHSGHVSWVSCLVGPPNEPPPEADFVLHT